MESNAPPVYPAAPPPFTPPPRYSQPRGGRGWMVLAIILSVVVVIILGSEVSRFMSGFSSVGSGGSVGGFYEEVAVEHNRSENKIALIEVEGMITSQRWEPNGQTMVERVASQLKIAAQDRSVKAVILRVDSPGGEVLASDDISRAILEFQEKHGKPVIASLNGLAASGGYYVAVPCQWIVANEMTITGSIGVIMHSFNYRGLLDKVGLHPQVFKSGKFKDMLSGSRKVEEIDPKEAEMIQAMIDETYDRFKKVVEKGRQRSRDKNEGNGKPLVENWEQYADGRVLTGRQAHEYGFVDETGSFKAAVDRAKKLAGISDANLIRYEEPFSLSRMLGFLGKSEGKTLKLDLGMDFPKLQVGRLYFLSATVLH